MYDFIFVSSLYNITNKERGLGHHERPFLLHGKERSKYEHANEYEHAHVFVRGGEMIPDCSACVEGGRKPFCDVLMATERKCCDCT